MKRPSLAAMRGKPFRFFAGLAGGITLLWIGLAACRPVTPTPSPVPEVHLATVGGAPAATTTPVMEGGASPAEPLRFLLPTPPVEPQTAWRPPLYPSPWAIAPFDHFYFARPVAADEVNWPLADYRYGGVFFSPRNPHTGVDIPARYGTPVLAAASGQVVWAGYGLYSGIKENRSDPYGLAVVLQHNFGYQDQRLYTVYAHLSEIEVAPGQWLETGEVLGEVGSTGFTTGPHLHFEVRLGVNDSHHTVNPELWLVPPQGWGVLVGRLTDYYLRPLAGYLVLVENLTTGQQWQVKTYSSLGVNSDPYYNENLVLSDLPAGHYLVRVPSASYRSKLEVDICPGQVTYFFYQTWVGFSLALPRPPAGPATPLP